jgi:hypothetical protein
MIACAKLYRRLIDTQVWTFSIKMVTMKAVAKSGHFLHIIGSGMISGSRMKIQKVKVGYPEKRRWVKSVGH